MTEDYIEWEEIPDSEPPLDVREFDLALAGLLTRTERRKVWKALREADLLVFRA